ncbi:MAG: GAF domain-containing protein, partial [Thermoanaerobaculia bacterium]
MADEPEEPDDELAAEAEEGEHGVEAEISALAELALCENLAQTSGWAARWSATMSGADATLLWAPDTVNPLFLCIGASGAEVERILRRSAPRETGIVHDLVRDRHPIVLTAEELASNDPFVRDVPPTLRACLAVPLEAEGLVVGLLALFFTRVPDADEALARVERFLEQAAPALGRALRAERKTVGMLHAIERLTNLYDLSKAFGSTIDTEELSGLIVRKAADFVTAETASLWMLDSAEGEVTLAATAVNENYEVASPPEAVGGSIVGDVVAELSCVRRNRIPAGDAENEEGYPVQSLLAAPLVEDETAVGALVLANKRGRHPEFSAEDEELLQDVARQAVRALRTARQHEAEKKVEELDALLAVSREITATLDLDKVMQTIVNATSALIHYDRCGIAIQEKGKLRLGAISGSTEVDRKNPDARRMEELLQWIFLSGTDTAVTQTEDGEITADRPETEEKFRALFQETGLRSFYGVLLKDEEGKLGALGFESKEPLVFDGETRDLLSILVNQATVAVRNAQLYQQVPLAGFWKPLLERRRKLAAIPKSRRRAWGIGVGVAALILFVAPWPLRIAGPARVLPGRRAAVTSMVDGVVGAVLRREGDRVEAGDVIATLKDESYQAALAEANSSLTLAESDIARARQNA